MSLYIAIRTAFVDLDGVKTHLREGAIAREGHRILEVAGDLFKPLVVQFEHVAEKVEPKKKSTTPVSTPKPAAPEPPAAPLPPVPPEGE
jgi:hypothetical protein